MKFLSATSKFLHLLFSVCCFFYSYNSQAQEFRIKSFKIDSTHLTYFPKDGKVGMLNYKGEVVVPAIYKGIDDYNEGVVIAIVDDDNLIILDNKNRVLGRMTGMNPKDVFMPQEVKVFWDLSYTDSLFLFLNKFYDVHGKIVKAPKHDFVCSPYMCDYALVADSIHLPDSSQARRYIRYGYINKKEELVSPLVYEAARPFIGNYAAVMTNGKWGYLDKTGKLKIPAIYDEAWDFSEGLAIVGIGDTVRCINEAGEVMIHDMEKENPTWFWHSFNNGLCPAFCQQKVGFVDKYGTYQIIPEYDNATDFDKQGYASVVKNGAWGVIDKKGNVVVDFISEMPINFSPAGVAIISRNGQLQVVTYTGKVLVGKK